MRCFGKVRGLHLYLAITQAHTHVTRTQNLAGIISYEISTLWSKKKGGLIDMSYVPSFEFDLFTVSWSWEQ